MLKTRSARDRTTFLIVLCLGYANGMQLGKLAPYIHRLETDQGLSLTFLGLLTSVLTVFVAVLGSRTGRFVLRIGPVAGLKLGAVFLAVGCVAFALAGDPGSLLAARVIEGIGHVLSMVAAPVLFATLPSRRLRSISLALWGSVVPVGFALSSFLASSLPAETSQSVAFFAYALPVLPIAGALLLLDRRPAERTEHVAARDAAHHSGRIAWVIVIGFGLYVYVAIGFLTFLPAFVQLNSHAAASPGVVALLVPAGSFLAAYMLTKLSSTAALALTVAGFLGIAATGPFIFSTGWSGGLAMYLCPLAMGVSTASLFAGIPVLVPDPASSSRTIGALAQAGGIAALGGPPISGLVVEQLGWAALGGTFCAVALVAAAIVLIAIRRRGGAAPAVEDQAARVCPE